MDLMQLLDMILHVDKSLGSLLAQYGAYVYGVLAAIVFCETGLVVLFFLPGDTLLFVAGAFCASGQMNTGALFATLAIAATLGNTLNYWIGEAIGHRVFTQDYRWINKDGLRRTHDFFEKHGGKTIVLARFIPVVRTFAPLVAGVSDMTHTRFQMYNVTGAVLWVAALIAAGYLFGDIPVVRDHLTAIVVFGASVAVVPLTLGGLWKFGRRLLRR